MHSLIKRCILNALIFLASPNSFSEDTSGLILNGAAVKNDYQTELYFAELFIGLQSNNAEQILNSNKSQKMSITVLADEWSIRRFNDYWNNALLINNSIESRNDFVKEISNFRNMLKGNLLRGDKILITKNPEAGLTVTLNETTLMSTKRPEAFKLFLNTWLGARPPSTEFKAKLLGNNDTDQLKLKVVSTLKPAPGRNKLIASWLKPKIKKTPKKQTLTTTIKNESKPAVTTKTPVKVTEKNKPTNPVIATIKKSTSEKNISKPKLTENSDFIVSTQDDSSLLQEKTATKLLPVSEPSQPPESSVTEAIAIKGSPNLKSEEKSASITPQIITTETTKKIPSEKDKLLNIYRSNVLVHTYQNLIYPTSAIDRKQEDNLIVKVTINQRGRITNMDFIKDSEYLSLNEATKKAIKKAAPYPRPPKALGKEITLELPIKFSLN